jgi:dihydroflavonol-4-reductase
MQILITGITGLLGAAFAKKALELGHTVRGFYRPSSNKENLNEISEQITFYEGDVLDVLSLEKAIEGVDWVFHAAAMVSFNPKDQKAMSKINIEGTTNVVNLCLAAGIKKLCFVSSVAALGRKPASLMNLNEETRISEEQKWITEGENSHYGFTKFQAECEVWRGISEGLPAFIINPSIILAEGNWNQSSAQLFKYVYQEKPFFTGGYINYVDVADVVNISHALFEKNANNERYILNAGKILLSDFFKKTAERFSKKPPEVRLNNFQIEIIWRLEHLRSIFTGSSPLISKETAQTSKLHLFYENEKIKKALNYSFNSLEKSLDRICAFYQKQTLL